MRILLIAASMLALAGTAHAHGVKRLDLKSVDRNPATCDWVQFDPDHHYVDCSGKAFVNWKASFDRRNPGKYVTYSQILCAGEHACPGPQLPGYMVRVRYGNLLSPVFVIAPVELVGVASTDDVPH